MTSEDFVKRIQMAVHDSAIDGTISLLDKVPGRRPSPALIRLSEWFHRLPLEDQEEVKAVIRLAVGNAVFGILAVLDGVKSIRKPEEKVGTLELHYIVEGQSTLLNDPNGEELHDIFVGEVPPM
jgi:hypothetical protein